MKDPPAERRLTELFSEESAMRQSGVGTLYVALLHGREEAADPAVELEQLIAEPLSGDSRSTSR